MKKVKFIFLAMLVVAIDAAAGIPEGYYTAADGRVSTDLKTALMNIILEHSTLSYNNLWDYYPYTYYVIENEEQVLDMYSSDVTYFTDHSNIDREHVVPKAWWGGSTDFGPGCDLYNVIPGEHTANNAKSDYPLGEVSGTARFDNGVVKVGSSGVEGYNGTVFEPADEDKGDFARIFFYVATCYPDVGWDDNNADAMTSSSLLTLQSWIIPMLLEWHAMDPVDDKEVQRNEDVCKYQENRNPFIDYPDLVDYIWGEKSGETFYFSEHVAHEGSANDNMKTFIPTFSIDYGTEDAPKGVAEGTEVTVTAGNNYSTLHIRVNDGEWEEIECSLGYNSTGGTYHIAATKTVAITGDVCIEAYCSLDGYANSNTIVAYYNAMDFDSLYLLYEAFDDITAGNNTSSSGSSTAWAGNDNFPVVEKVYQAGGVLRMGASGSTGSITSRELATSGGTITIEFDVKGWTTIEGQLVVELSGADSQMVTYSATMADDFEHVTLEFNNVSASPTLTIATTAKRAFIDNIIAADLTSSIPLIGSSKSMSTDAYNLAGQKVNADTYRGIVIRNGRKILR